jgi:hypothetical protein
MDPRNYKGINDKRISATTKLGDVNELDPDFEIQLKDGLDEEGETYPINIKVTDYIESQKKLDKETVLKTYSDENFDDVVETLDNDDVICPEFSKKKKFSFIFSLNGLNPFHVYKYDIQLTGDNKMTPRRMYKIICRSAKHVLQDTLKFIKEHNYKNEMFDVNDKLNQLEVDYIGVKVKKSVIYVGYSGFEIIDPRNTL